ncbi:MAG: signal peptidase I, partial [Firmicutes bacterium]|nr:signal peptidase I [Bacillota bacterium]
VYLNGEAIDEPYTKEGYTGTEMAEITIPEGRIFVMGDNRQNSSDSRSKSVGLVAFDDVVGKVVFRLYPFNKMGSVYK